MMKLHRLLTAFAAIPVALALGPNQFRFTADSPGLKLASPGLAPEIRVAKDDLPGVIRVAADLAADFGRVTGTNGTVVQSSDATTRPSNNRRLILLGTLGKSTLVGSLVTSGSVDDTVVKGKWETYSLQVTGDTLVILGSDLRGSVFGAYSVSEAIGVSPWHYWLDAPPKKREYVYYTGSKEVDGPPSVKYRGIFLNDEAPALTTWGAANFPKSQYGSAFTSGFYKKIFELVLRMKGNYVWPAMWSSMFYLDDAQNGPMASDWGIFMGTSHHEPMARADKEQGRFMSGAWDWKSNKANVQTFMKAGVERSKTWATMYTLGMRGSGDAASSSLTAPLLEEAIRWQQQTLTSVLGKPLSEIPQSWVMYKEVPGYWANGMNVSEDVTLLWSDDNRGNIRRIPINNENNRRGGSGIYYHFDYVGDPRNYKWINTIQLQKTWEQMNLAHKRGIRQIWLANVGDLKALELPTAHFMALAWDQNRFEGSDSTYNWLVEWSAQQFGDEAAKETADIMTKYGTLTARRKYEDMSGTFAFSTVNYDEAENNFAEWVKLGERAQAVYDKLPAANQPTFFQSVLHAVLAGKAVHEIYHKAALGSQYATMHRMSANELKDQANAAFAYDKSLKQRWDQLNGGRWKGFMEQKHLGYNNWQEPASDTIPALKTVSGSSGKSSPMGVSAQGSTNFYPTATSLSLTLTNPYTTQKRWIDIFARDAASFGFKITSNASFVAADPASGTVKAPGATSDVRSAIKIDWAAAPAGRSTVALTVASDGTGGAAASVVVTLPIINPTIPSDFKGHVESDGVVSLEAEHRGTGSSPEYVAIPDYGRTLSGIKLPATTPSQQPGKGPVLLFPFFLLNDAASASITFYLSASDNANPGSPNRYSFAVDEGTLQTVQPTPNGNPNSQPAGWSQAVIQNAWVKTDKISGSGIKAGAHVLKVWLLEPTMVLTKIVVDVGGVKSSLMGPPESGRVV